MQQLELTWYIQNTETFLCDTHLGSSALKLQGMTIGEKALYDFS